MLRSVLAVAAVAALGFAMLPDDASARPAGRGAGPSFRGPSVRSFSGPPIRSFRAPIARSFNRGPGVPFAARRHFRGARVFIPGAVGYGLYQAYPYGYDECLQPTTVLTPWGPQTQWVNVCDPEY